MPMPRETFDLHFQQCDHLIKIPLLHNAGDPKAATVA
jgi:hypothetical protein